MKKIISIAAGLLVAVSSFGVGFPVFFGDQNNYFSNNGNAIVVVISNKVTGYYFGNPRQLLLTNNSANDALSLDNGTGATTIGFHRNGGDAVRIGVTTAGVFKMLNASNSLTSFFDFDLSTQILSIPSTTPVWIRGFQTNDNSLVVNADATVKGWAKIVQTVTGTGGANTNFSIYAPNQAMVYMNGGLTNICLTIMGGETARAFEGSFLATNWTATSRTLAFSAVSNSWQSVTHYDGVATNGETLTITNNTGIAGWWRINGSNVTIALKHVTLPSN